jgi:hypothetical protein
MPPDAAHRTHEKSKKGVKIVLFRRNLMVKLVFKARGRSVFGGCSLLSVLMKKIPLVKETDIYFPSCAVKESGRSAQLDQM